MSKPRKLVAIVTGASRGIGSATARSLAGAGMNVVLAVRDPASARALAAELEQFGTRMVMLPCDVTHMASVTVMVDETVRTFGSVDILINNAGVIGPIAVTAETDEEEWTHNIQVNLIGAYHGVKAVLPHMLSQGAGTIINLSSGAAHNPLEGWSAYCSAKAGLAMLTRSLALEYGQRGIRVFGFAPGTTDTDMQAVIRTSGVVNLVSKLKRSDLIPIHEPAAAIAYLCTPAADDLAGSELTLNDATLRRRVGIRVLEPRS